MSQALTILRELICEIDILPCEYNEECKNEHGCYIQNHGCFHCGEIKSHLWTKEYICYECLLYFRHKFKAMFPL